MSKIDPNKLLISSDFYSVQGEGISSGVPSYFVRLGICNLTCGMSRAFANKLAKEQKLEDGEIFVGDLHAEDKATRIAGLEISVVAESIPHLRRGALKDFLKILKWTNRFNDEQFNKSLLTYNIIITQI